MKPLENLAFLQIEMRLEKIRAISSETKVRPGWINYMRQALCMSLGNLAKLSNLSSATVQQTEKREANKKVTLETLSKMADAMNCELIYAFVPKKKIKEFLRDKAYEKAAKLVRSADVHMELEGQKVTQEITKRIKRIAEDLLAKGDIW